MIPRLVAALLLAAALGVQPASAQPQAYRPTFACIHCPPPVPPNPDPQIVERPDPSTCVLHDTTPFMGVLPQAS
jgi:hypothetical protein